MSPPGSRIPDEHVARLAGLPAPLRALLEAELAAGNGIVEVGSSFPAPPVGVYVKLARPVSTRPRADGDGISFYDRNGALYSGEFHDERRFHFILEPPHPPEPEPAPPADRAPAAGGVPGGSEAVHRFRESMVIDFDAWHDGTGYDLSALTSATPAERRQLESLLVARGVSGWRDVEALAALETPAARELLQAAMQSSSLALRLAVIRHAPGVASHEQRVGTLVEALQTAEFFGGLSQALDELPDFHPQPVLDALFRGALQRGGDVAVHCAAMLTFLHGKADEPFDWEQRPFFLRFHTDEPRERQAVFRELCERLGVKAETYLAR